ncbi:MAG: hypothetical protein V4574_12010 [Pseudomonadota bacterium]
MRRFAYDAIRKAPNALIGAAVFVVSSWAAIDSPSLKAWLVWKWEHLDASTTGALIAILVMAYVLSLWISRAWNQTDRDFYKGQLQIIYAEIGQYLSSAHAIPTDEQWALHFQETNQALTNHVAWIRHNMGEAAVTKFLESRRPRHGYAWAGEHSPQAAQQRDNVIDTLIEKQETLTALMGSDQWDHPVPLSKRRRAIRWRARKDRIKALVTRHA